MTKIKWDYNLAYTVGLITTDGCLSNDGRHIDFTSKDLELINIFKSCLNITNKIGVKSSGFSDRKYYRVQFGNVKLYRFLIEIGLTPRKSKTLSSLRVPKKYYRDFLRGCLDGDGYTNFYYDKRWKNSFMFYTGLVSASKSFLEWINYESKKLFGVEGIIKKKSKEDRQYFVLEYAKKNSSILLSKVYYKNNLFCLERKRLKFIQASDIIRRQNNNVNIVSLR